MRLSYVLISLCGVDKNLDSGPEDMIGVDGITPSVQFQIASPYADFMLRSSLPPRSDNVYSLRTITTRVPG